MKFKCKESGNVYDFEHPHDIEQLLKHEGYEAVKEEEKEVVDTKRKYVKKDK